MTFLLHAGTHLNPPLTEDMFYTMLSDIPHECTVSPDEVLYLIKCLNVKEANGVDGISAYMLKATAESIVSPLAKVFSLPLSSGKFPTLWKSVCVVPILKSGNRSDVSNYRQCAGKTCYTKTTQLTPSLHLFLYLKSFCELCYKITGKSNF